MTENSFKEIMALLKSFTEVYKKEEEKLPYHINLIDDLRADENAHSRILGKLLQQKTSDNKFEILESFLSFIKGKYTDKDLKKIEIKKPRITQEKCRIDLWVQDKDYAVIFENKVNYAPDQHNRNKGQLEHYIDVTKEKYNIENIFVIYLHNEKEPDEQSWGEYRENFKNRYLRMSFSDDILCWLKKDVLPQYINTKDKFLSSALEQYIDHLEGKYNLREIDKNKNMVLQELIKEEIRLNGLTSQESIEKLNEKKEELSKIINQIDLLTSSLNLELAEKYISERRSIITYPENFIDPQREKKKNDENNILTIVEKDKGFATVLYYDQSESCYFYGINTWDTDNNIKYKGVEFLVQEINKELNLKGWGDKEWYIKCRIEKDEDAYSKFEQLLEKVIETVGKK
ncbi:PDDEXK-like family protein [Dysgonomonas termitidis]|uniref:PD-(D/E)XK nuclease family protein n=1 Tax=Dysgonomonas termitidis TaxID=1516126 RepID=A0ABV9KSA6_9BACT